MTTKDKPDKFIPTDMFEQLFAKLYELKKIKVDLLKERSVELKKLDAKYTKNIDQVEKDIYKLEDGMIHMSNKKEYLAMRNDYEKKHGIKENAQNSDAGSN